MRMGKRNLWLLAWLLIVTSGCSQQDTECLARISQKMVTRTESWLESLQQSFGGSFQAGLGLAGRVSVRLGSDKGLDGAVIEVQVNGNVVELKGTVAEEGQRRRAVGLTESTLGVEQVVDSLQLAQPQ